MKKKEWRPWGNVAHVTSLFIGGHRGPITEETIRYWAKRAKKWGFKTFVILEFNSETRSFGGKKHEVKDWV